MQEDALPKFNIDEVPDFLRPYFEAKEKGILPAYYLSEFIRFRDDYKDDLPEEDIRNLVTLDGDGRFVGGNYKCRGNYISGLAGALDAAIADGIISSAELIAEIDSFRNHDFQFHHSQRTTQEEINMINTILAKIINYLENEN